MAKMTERVHRVRTKGIDFMSDENEHSACNPLSSGRCGTCLHFKRGKFHAVIGGGEQSGGKCVVLKEMLSVSNSSLWTMEDLHVYESFGCSAHQETGDQRGDHNNTRR